MSGPLPRLARPSDPGSGADEPGGGEGGAAGAGPGREGPDQAASRQRKRVGRILKIFETPVGLRFDPRRVFSPGGLNFTPGLIFVWLGWIHPGGLNVFQLGCGAHVFCLLSQQLKALGSQPR